MRILSWNINGIRTLPQYHPWNTMPAFNEILDALEADILCFQEVKSSRQALLKEVAIPPSYHAFFSFPVRKSGYSGVSTYVRKKVATPAKAEEGLSGIIQPKPPLDASERISGIGAYPQAVISEEDDIDIESSTVLDYKDLDSEGRTLVLDFGLFVLINVYCPNDGNGTEERDKFKMDFHRVLEARVKGLVKEGREVIVVGDLNACAAVIDHCEGLLMVSKGLAEGLEGEEGFWGKDARRWLKGWMVAEDGSGGPMVDITRKLWPDRKGMYTCWNTKISARETNYGTRIDYTLITRGLLPWVKAADIQPHIKGSDHCPIYVDLHDEIVDSNGVAVKLLDAMGFNTSQAQEPPRIASKFWSEYSGKQQLLQQFFNKANALSSVSATPSPSGMKDQEPPTKGSASKELETTRPVETSSTTVDHGVLPMGSPPTQENIPASISPSSTINMSPKRATPPSPLKTKRKLTADALLTTTKKSKAKMNREPERSSSGQATLSSFFAKPKRKSPLRTSSDLALSRKLSKELDPSDELEITEIGSESDGRDAFTFSSQDVTESSLVRSAADTAETKQAWSSLLAPIQPPNCVVHQEPAKEYTVNKSGANKGKRFFICSRPVGPGYDKGRGERLREHVDPQWRCDFFKWSADVRREMRKKEPP